MELTENRINRIVSDVLGIPLEEVVDETSPDTISGWDSMAHLNLIMALEAELGVSLDPEDAIEMQSVRLIRVILSDYKSD